MLSSKNDLNVHLLKVVGEREWSEIIILYTFANKLLKQAFAIAKSGRPYDENYRSKLA